MMKKIWLIGVLVLMVISGCSKSKEKQLDIAKVSEDIEKNYQDTIMVEMTDSDFFEKFELDPSQVKQHFYQFAFLDVRADELVMIQVADSSLVESIKTILTKRMEELRAEFDQYIPEQKEIVDRSIIFSDGSYVFLIVSPQATQIQDYIISKFQE